MNRVSRGKNAKEKRKKLKILTKGCLGSHSKLLTTMKQQYLKSYSYAYSDRQKKGGNYRKLWINRINSKLKERLWNTSYTHLLYELKNKSIKINRKILAKICIIDEQTIEIIVKNNISRKS